MILYCILFSSCYGIIETIYRQIKKGTFKYTTMGQTCITFLWTPCIIYHFTYFQNYGIILFPFNVWLCEIIFGNLFLFVFKKRLWYYKDNLSFINNTISIYFFSHWLILGILINLFLKYHHQMIGFNNFSFILLNMSDVIKGGNSCKGLLKESGEG